jgi:hypothetical protein
MQSFWNWWELIPFQAKIVAWRPKTQVKVWIFSIKSNISIASSFKKNIKQLRELQSESAYLDLVKQARISHSSFFKNVKKDSLNGLSSEN